MRHVGLLLLFAALAVDARSADFPETILTDGKIVTGDSQVSVVQAFLISGKKFSGIGIDEEIAKLAGPDTRRIDLRGKTVVPGFIRGHPHMDREGLKFILPSLKGTRQFMNGTLRSIDVRGMYYA